MNRWFLAGAALLAGAAGTASADYIVIIANVGHSNTPSPTGIGAPPGGSGFSPAGSGAPPGGSGFSPAGSGAPPGGSGFSPAGSGFPPAGSGAPPAGSGGPAGVGPQGGPAEGEAINVAAVVEVEAPYKDLLAHAVIPRIPQLATPLVTKYHLGLVWGLVRLQNYPGLPLDLHFAPPEEPVLTVAKRIEAKYNDVFKDKSGAKPSADKILDLADYALTHGRNDKFVEFMKKLGEDNPTNPAFVAFQKVQADLDRPVTRDDSAAWQKRLGETYKPATLNDNKGHYVLFHNLPGSDQDEVQERLKRLEDSLHTFYYWFALRGVVLPAPDGRLPALLTDKEPEFRRTRASLSDPPVVGDAFFARRQDLLVLCARPLDPQYDMLDRATDPLFKQYGFIRQEMISSKEYAGPRGTPPAALASGQTLALLMKALEDEAELTGISHDASRQLLFASGLLPRGVVAPEWVQFGMGSFFETPEHSPWPTPAGASDLYLPLFRQEMSDKGQKFEGDAYKSLRKIVTDGYFRELTPEQADGLSPQLLTARTAAWSLTYFLARRKLDNLRRYFKVLSDMPRDLELDDGVLWECFARSFDAYDPATRRFDDAKLGTLAAEWQDDVGHEPLEAEELLQSLAKTLRDIGVAAKVQLQGPRETPRTPGSKEKPRPTEPKETPRPREPHRP